MSARRGFSCRLTRIRLRSFMLSAVVLVSSSVAPASGIAAGGSGYGVESFAVEPLGSPTGFTKLEPPSKEIGEPLGQEPFTQAAGRPADLTTTIALNTTSAGTYRAPTGNPRDISVKLPPGIVGDPTAIPACTRFQSERFECSQAAQVGIIQITLAEPPNLPPTGNEVLVAPLYNMVPPAGYPAAFGGRFNNFANAFIYAKVRTGEDYGVDAESLGITALANAIAVKIRVWGVPGSPSHNEERFCADTEHAGASYNSPEWCAKNGQEPASLPERPFLENPTVCDTGPLLATAVTDSFQEPGVQEEQTAQIPAMTQCATVPFAPTIEANPTTTVADTHTGLNVDLHVPQHEEPEGQAASDLKDATVTFPPGLVVDPSSADGLGACSEQQVGFTGFKELDPEREPGVKTSQFTPQPAECPDASKLGSVTIDTPLIDHPLTGGLYLAKPTENPFGSLIAVYLTVNDPVSGVVVKLPGSVEANPATGQLTSTFEQNPQLPFEDLKVDLPDGPRAALTTPIACGSYATSTQLVPWSTPEGQTATPSSEPFSIAEAPSGGACANSEAQAPNTPAFEAGTVSPVAGSYSPFVLHLTREDGSQRFQALSVTLPRGLIGKVAGLQECPQADIETAQSRGHEGEGALEQSSPSCPAGSEVGVVHVGSGSGTPYYVTGHAYFAGPYANAPFSLVVVTPAVAGPFDLGTVVVRAGLYIDPNTAQVTVKSDPFPTILDGIPLDIRDVSVEITRHEFTLNPTSCAVMSLTGQEQSTAGQTASLSDRFQAGGCTNLPFRPSFTASSSGVTSRSEGASLTVHVSSGPGQANIAKVRVELPKQLPARNDTLKLACREAVFAANPANCPEGSHIGTAVASTPILASPLTGPAYLVSHGGAAFPDLEIVLQAEGVTIVLDGKTNIDEKTGITSSSFEAVPDAPINTFELRLPRGPHSILGAPSGVCGLTRTVLTRRKITVRAKGGHRKTVTRTVRKSVPLALAMPTTIVAQNGAQIKQSTPIALTGCPKARAKPEPKHKAKPRQRANTPRNNDVSRSSQGVTRDSVTGRSVTS